MAGHRQTKNIKEQMIHHRERGERREELECKDAAEKNCSLNDWTLRALR